jgi:hypothetical protein
MKRVGIWRDVIYLTLGHCSPVFWSLNWCS